MLTELGIRLSADDSRRRRPRSVTHIPVVLGGVSPRNGAVLDAQMECYGAALRGL
jgi:hypothetical protein